MNLHRFLHIILLILLLFISRASIVAQHTIDIKATLNAEAKTITIQQQISYHNKSKDTLSEIILLDWANSFSSKTTPLGKRFSEDFQKRFYYAKDEERGSTHINSIIDTLDNDVSWVHYRGKADILKLILQKPIPPEETYTFLLQYKVKLPDEKFTRYGYYENGDFHLKYWYIVPAVYDGSWQAYSNKDLDDLYAASCDYTIQLDYPKGYEISSEFDQDETINDSGSNRKILKLNGDKRNEVILFIEKEKSFYTYQMNGLQLVSNIEDNELNPEMKSVATKRVMKFLHDNLGAYPFKKILISKNDYKDNPVYGLNQLPGIIRPFPDGFQYEVKQLKAITEGYLEKTLLINPRYNAWIKDAIHIYLMMVYTEEHYPKMKLIGNLSNIFGIRWFHAADIEFNDQYFLGYKNMARLYLDQPLSTPNDELVKFNKNIANAYKAGVGLKYLEDYAEDPSLIKKSIREFYTENLLQLTNAAVFEKKIKSHTNKDVDWFFTDFIESSANIDFKIKAVKRTKDSLKITIKNRHKNTMPISLNGIKDGKVIYKSWIKDIDKSKKITIQNQNFDKLALDYDQKVPEINRRNNYRNLKWILNRPLELRILQDIEDPTKSQVFLIPEFEFNNIYDGFVIGSKIYNSTVIRRDFQYKITPSYGFRSKALIGSAGFKYQHQIAEDGLYQITYQISGGRSSIDFDKIFVDRITPVVAFKWRQKDLRSNERQQLTFRSNNLFRDEIPEKNVPVSNNINRDSIPNNYSIFNTRYVFSDFNLTNFRSLMLDYQVAKNFSKISATANFRKTFLNNRSINFRFFAGSFLFNDTQKYGDYFSFALDRPTDYLFDFNYLGRSEEEGLTSQQVIIAEGGFKSQLQFPFANQWMTTLNTSTNIWNWIYLYGDVGLVKNKGVSPKFVYDSGVRLSLVQDYFEIFLPIASNNGWEIAQPNYNEKIRFIITLSPETLIGLFTREWY